MSNTALGESLLESLDAELGDPGSRNVDSDELFERVEVFESGVGDVCVAEFESFAAGIVLEVEQSDVCDVGMAEVESFE